jgi:hypothetical protein
MRMVSAHWSLSDDERRNLESALDALLPSAGSFPAPSATGIIDDFIIPRLEPAGSLPVPYPGLTADDLKAILLRLDGDGEIAGALERLELEFPVAFKGLWALAVYGYYSRPEVIEAIQQDHAPAYHGAPLPLGYEHAIEPWNPDDPLQNPRQPRGSFIPTDAVRRIVSSEESGS